MKVPTHVIVQPYGIAKRRSAKESAKNVPGGLAGVPFVREGDISGKDLKRFLQSLADLSGAGLSFYNRAWEKKVETLTLPPVCRLLHQSEAGRGLCEAHCQSAISDPSKQLVQTFTCPAGITAFAGSVRIGNHRFGYLTSEKGRLSRELGSTAERKLRQLASQIGIDSEKLIKAYERTACVSPANLAQQRKAFLSLVGALSGMAGESWLSRLVDQIKSCAERLATSDLWPVVDKAIRLLVPAGSVEIFAVAPAHDAVTAVWPRSPSRVEPLDLADIRHFGKRGFRINARGAVLLRINYGDTLLAVVRIRSLRNVQLDMKDFTRLARLADATAETLNAIRARAAKQCLNRLEGKFKQTRDHYRRLQIIMEDCARLVGSDMGDISLVAHDDRGWLRVVHRFGKDVNNLPYLVPADVGINGRVIRTRMTAVVPRASQDADFNEVLSDVGKLSHKYQETHWRRYQAYLGEVGSSVKLPLKAGREVLGVLCLHRLSWGDFDLDAVSLAENLAARAGVEAAAVQASEDLSRQLLLPEKGKRDLDDLAPLVASLPPADAIHTLCEHLANEAMNMSKAYRSAVQMLSPDGQTLNVAVTAQRTKDSWPAEFSNYPVPLTEDRASTWSLRNRMTYLIEDTREKGIHLLPVAPEAGSHASIVLKAGAQILGVLSLDWVRARVFDAVLIRALETLAERHAAAIKAWGMDDLFRKIETFLKPSGETQSALDYQSFLRIVADVLGVHQGALFLRRPRTGRYHLAAHLTHPDFCNPEFSDREENSYGTGEGLTGWVAKNNNSLRLVNIADSCELQAIDPKLRWSDRVFDGITHQNRNNSYLGVPIAVGNEILGVLRFASGSRGYFSAYDQQIALAAASQLAGYLYEESEKRRTQALLDLSSRVAVVGTQKELASDIFAALAAGLDECDCHIRVLDRLPESTGQVVPVLRQLAVSTPEWETAPVTRQKGEGIAGRTWTREETLLYQDTSQESWARKAISQDLQTGDALITLGSGACVRILAGGGFFGTLHVHKRFPHALSHREITFVEEIARLAGSALQLAGRMEDDKLLVDLQTASGEFLRGIIRGAPVRAQENNLLISVLDALHRNLGSGLAWVRTQNELRTHFRCLEVRGDISSADVTDVSIEHASSVLPKSFGVISDLTRDSGLRSFITLRGASYIRPPSQPGRPLGAVVMLNTTEGALALFSLIEKPSEHFSYEKVERIVKMLVPVGEVIQIGRRFEASAQDLEVTWPLALMGAMFSRLEHELRSPVSNLKGAIDNIMTGQPNEAELSEMLAVIKEERDKLQAVLGQMVLMIGSSRTPEADVNLRSCLFDIEKELWNRTQGPTFELRSSEHGLTVTGIAEHLRSAFRFVIKNALEAAESKGEDGKVVVTVTRQSADFCKIVIDDNGSGMPADDVTRALEPFYTTKLTGTGLGLPAAYCIFRMHGGQLRVSSDPERGSKVTITLPLATGGI